MKFKQAIEMILKDCYLDEMKLAKDNYFHDFPVYLTKTKEIIERYESSQAKQYARVLLNKLIQSGEISVVGDEIECNCGNCKLERVEDNDFYGLLQMYKKVKKTKDVNETVILANAIATYCDLYNVSGEDLIVKLDKKALQ